MIIVDPDKVNSKVKKLNGGTEQEQSLIYVEKEEDLFEEILSLIEVCDPEILIGWDIEFLSWGYIFQRASAFGKNLSGKISRIPSAKCSWETKAHDQSTTELHLETLAEVKLPGRIVLDIWRIMRSEIGRDFSLTLFLSISTNSNYLFLCSFNRLHIRERYV